MAQGKKSIIVYAEWIEIFNSLSDDEAGRLIKHFFSYVNDLNPIAPDRITEISFIPIKQSLKRDLSKWAETIDKRSQSGRLGGLKSAEARQSKTKQNEANEANASNLKQTQANEAVNVNVNDNVNVLTKVNDIYGGDFANYVGQWLEYKKTRKESYKSEKSIMIFCEKLSKLSKGQISNTKEIIETSMANNWAGIFELKANQEQKPKSRIEQMQELYYGAKQ